jgi:cell division cycle 2-like protein
MTTIASSVVSICAMIGDLAEETMSARRVAAISAMIHDVAEEEATPSSTTTTRKKRRRMGSARSYEETCTLSERGGAVVSKARHRATGQTVVIKAFKHECGEEVAIVGMLLREACFMAACRGHPNAVTLHGIARAPGTSDYSIVMEHVGPTLDHILHDRVSRLGRPFTEAEVRGIMRQLLSAAAAMHDHRIIHQDINPENIFIDGSGDDDTSLVVKIGGYKVAMSTAEPDAYDSVYRFAGRSEYMAPETLVWKDYGTRVDTWSLGCVMAELLTGERLFVSENRPTNQLDKIFDLLGVPGKKAYNREFQSPFSLPTDEVVDLWRREQKQRARHRSRLREMFPEKTLSKEGFEVLKGLLTCIPSKRLDAAAALQLPWFAKADHHAPAPAPALAPSPAPVVAAVSKSGGAAMSIWAMTSYSWQVALSCF